MISIVIKMQKISNQGFIWFVHFSIPRTIATCLVLGYKLTSTSKYTFRSVLKWLSLNWIYSSWPHIIGMNEAEEDIWLGI